MLPIAAGFHFALRGDDINRYHAIDMSMLLFLLHFDVDAGS